VDPHPEDVDARAKPMPLETEHPTKVAASSRFG
jgi:hypothetical protein